MDEIKLSFCIPTYNRCELLNELIESIINQLNHRVDVEICISDNCSDDNTELMVSNWKIKSKIPIIYKKNERNIGPDKNYLSAVELASGEYCWLFGSDDKLAENAIEIINNYLLNNFDIYLTDRVQCDYNMKVINYTPWMKTGDKVYNTENLSEVIEYFNNSKSIGAVFSFLSSIVVKRKKWNEVEYTEKFIGTAYAHVYYLLSIFKESSSIQYINKPLVLCRGGNDYFLRDGVVKRILLDFDGYFMLANYFWEFNNEIKKELLAILLKERPVMRTCLILSEHGSDREKEKIKSYYLQLGVKKITISFYYSLRCIYLLMKRIKNKIKA